VESVKKPKNADATLGLTVGSPARCLSLGFALLGRAPGIQETAGSLTHNLLFGFVSLIVLLLHVGLCGLLSPAVAGGLEPGVIVPEFTLPSLGGETTFHSTELFQSQTFTLLVFWNSECPQCLEALAKCEEFSDTAGAHGIRLVGINDDIENLASVRSFLKNERITFPQLSDVYRTVAAAYGADAYSLSLFLIDSSGMAREIVYDRPPDVQAALFGMLKKASQPAFAGRAEKDAGGQSPRPEGEQSGRLEALETTVSALRKEVSRIAVTGNVRIRTMDMQVDRTSSIGGAPTGPYGEALEQGKSITHRFQCELSARITNSVMAGALLRLSNEDVRILALGPQYFSGAEGSAFAQYASSFLSIRLGYFDTYFTPLSLMRWDLEDNPESGGRATECACAGATGAVLLQSLEELGPKLTFEGANLSSTVADLMDVNAFYARPRSAHEVTTGEYLANPEALGDFAYRQDLYGLRATFNVGRLTGPGKPSVSLHYVTARDDEESAKFPGAAYDHRSLAVKNEVYGAALSIPFQRKLSLDMEFDRTKWDGDVRSALDGVVWGTGWLGTLRAELLPGLRTSAAYFYLSDGFHSAYGALSYAPGRKGARGNVSVTVGPLYCDLFTKYAEPDENEFVAVPMCGVSGCYEESRFDDQLTIGLWVSAKVLRLVEAGGGWILEREAWDLYDIDPVLPAGRQHLERERKKNTLTFELTHAFSARNSAELLYQYIDYEDDIFSANDYTAQRTSLQFSLRF